MKKLISVLLSAAMTAGAMGATAFAEETPRSPYAPVYALGEDVSLYAMGDVNMDGEIDSKDANAVSYEFNVTELLGMDSVLTEDQRALANVYDPKGDGSVDVRDANTILTYYAGRIIEFEGIENMTVMEFWDYKMNRGFA